MGGYGTVLVVRRQGVDRFGDRTGPATDSVYSGWDIAPMSTTEDVGDGRSRLSSRNAVETRLVAYGGPPDHGIRSDDRVYLDSDDRTEDPPWQVIGDPEWWTNPGWGSPAAGIAMSVVTLQRVLG